MLRLLFSSVVDVMRVSSLLDCSLNVRDGSLLPRLLVLQIYREGHLKGQQSIENCLKNELVYKINMIAQGLFVWVYQQKALKKMH